MKKILLPIPVLVVMLAGCASKSCFAGIIPKWVRGSGNVVEEQRHVSDFDGVHLAGMGNLIIVLGDEEDLRVKAEDNLLPYIETYVQSKKLVIEIEDNVELDPTEPIYYYLTAKKLNAISVSGSGNVEAPQLEAKNFSAKVSGSGDIHIEGLAGDSATMDISGSGNIRIDSLNAESIETKISGSGDVLIGNGKIDEQRIKISGSGHVKIDGLSAESIEADISGSGSVSIGSGKIDEQKIKISGSGAYEAKGLESVRAEVELTGSSSVTLWVNDHLAADISGAGSVNYAGSPKIDADISGSGKIKQIEEQ